MKNDTNTIEAAIDMAKIYQERVKFIQMTISLTTDDFSKVARIESMLTVYSDHLEEHKARVSQVNMDKEVWKKRIQHIGLHYFQVILNFSVTHLEWCGSAVKQDRSVTSFAMVESWWIQEWVSLIMAIVLGFFSHFSKQFL